MRCMLPAAVGPALHPQRCAAAGAGALLATELNLAYDTPSQDKQLRRTFVCTYAGRAPR
jgi:hypothetical protein